MGTGARSLPIIGGLRWRPNTSTKSFRWGFEAQSLAWPFIELPSHSVQLRLCVHRQVGSLDKILPQQAVGVLIGSTLPRTLRVAEVDVDIGRQGKPPMIGKLLAPVVTGVCALPLSGRTLSLGGAGAWRK